MISLSTYRDELNNLPHTLKALGNINMLISSYETKSNGVSCHFKYAGETIVQFDNEIIVDALKRQAKIITDRLAKLGIDASA